MIYLGVYREAYRLLFDDGREVTLEEKREELVEKAEELQRRIDAAKSEETIRSYAQEQGWTLGND